MEEVEKISGPDRQNKNTNLNISNGKYADLKKYGLQYTDF